MTITVKVTDRYFGGYEEKREISNSDELRALIEEMESYPQTRDFSTTITLSGIDDNGEPYFRQIL